MTSTAGDQLSTTSDFQKSPARKSRTLGSRLGSLFTSKPSHVNEPHIILDGSPRVYHPGDKLKGTFVLDVARPLGVTHIVVSLFGYLEVFKNHARNKGEHRDNVARLASGKGKRWVSEYYGDGFASLFEDEAVLCGKGCLYPKLYHFRFELDFPGHLNLPSSIWFERGTVRYVVSATITRPTTMNPTTITSCKVEFKEDIDVGAMADPKPRVITLEPVDRGSRARTLRRLTSQNMNGGNGSIRPASQSSSHEDQSSQTTATRQNPGAGSSRAHTPSSPSIASSMSMQSGNARESTQSADTRSSRTSQSQRTEIGSASSIRGSSRTIMALVQLSKAGCLPGEIMNLTVTINHTKMIRSVKGVIVTLFRQARVDMHPNLPLPSSGGKSQKYEDYYPRSKTGLGGLSLSAAGSGQVWRKDLCQAFAPLFINPATMSTVVKMAVRVPDDSFPTFRNAPGNMISFRYFVEVVIDIHGKLAGLPGLSEDVDVPNSQSPMNGMNGMGDSISLQESAYAPRWSANCVDTAQIRRDKNAVVWLSELIVGTKDSGKSRGKARRTVSNDQPDSVNGRGASFSASPHRTGSDAENRHGQGFNGRQHSDASYYEGSTNGAGRWPGNSYYGYDQEYNQWDEEGYWQDPEYPDGDGSAPYWNPDFGPPEPYSRQPPLLRPPEEGQISEKEQLRRQEEALLPSQPPQVLGASSTEDNTPSAPYIPDENQFSSSEAFRDAVAAHAHSQVRPAGSSSMAEPSSSRPWASNYYWHDDPSQPAPSYTASPRDVDQTVQGPTIPPGGSVPTPLAAAANDSTTQSVLNRPSSADGALVSPQGGGEQPAPQHSSEAEVHPSTSNETVGATQRRSPAPTEPLQQQPKETS